MTEDAALKAKQIRTKKYMLVRYGRMKLLSLFEHNEKTVPRAPTRVLIKTEKGLELGELVGQLGPYKGGQFRWTKEQIKKYFDDSEVEFSCKPAGRFIRYATAEDISEEKHLEKIAKDEMDYCSKLVKQMALPMKIVAVEHIFGGERIVFYFMSDSRIDFRELVKQVAHEYQTRIEMRQIGSRDEAKLLGDLETCGQQCCCARFLKDLKPVNMRMAKMQKATLDPAKISGYCGRLKCCLRYEDLTYTELKKRLPRKGTRVRSEQGEGIVLDGQILTQLIMVEYGDGKRASVPLEQLEIESQPGHPNQRRREPRAEEPENSEESNEENNTQ